MVCLNAVPVFLNGKIMPCDQAMISVTDRGFMLGDGVYEVIPFYGQRGFRVTEHIARLLRSLAMIHLDSPYSPEKWLEYITLLSAQYSHPAHAVYIQVTRGPAVTRQLTIPINVTPTVYMMVEPLTPPDTMQVQQGIKAVTAEDSRWLRCDIKSISLLGAILLRQYAEQSQAAEAILIRAGYLTEGTASNVFIVKDNVLYSPPVAQLLLVGVTYDVVTALAQQHGIVHQMIPISREALFSADEIWLTSSTKEILAVTQLDGVQIGQGRPGALFQKMHRLFQQFKSDVMQS
jgi:D-alanine transaminase